jgi:uncharacterized membrane protein required for colicin V production
MHWLDITILLVLGIGAVFGFASGLLWQIARFASLALSFYLAIALNALLTDWLTQLWHDGNPIVCRVIAFTVVFLLVYLLLYWLTLLLHKAIKATRLETMDRVLGALLGMAKMSAVVSLACAGLVALALPMTQAWLDQSLFARPFARGTEIVFGMIPQDYRDRVQDGVQQARDQLQKKGIDAAVEHLKQ